MPKLIGVIVCQRAIISQQNTLTLVDILEDVGVPPPPEPIDFDLKKPVPFIPIRFAIVSLWERANDHDVANTNARIRMIGPTGKQFGMVGLQIELANFQRFRSISEAPGFPYQGHGTYVIRVEVRQGARWKLSGSSRFNVVAVEQVH